MLIPHRGRCRRQVREAGAVPSCRAALRHHSVWWERMVLDVGKPELVRRSLGHRVLRLLDIQASLGVQMKGEWRVCVCMLGITSSPGAGSGRKGEFRLVLTGIIVLSLAAGLVAVMAGSTERPAMGDQAADL